MECIVVERLLQRRYKVRRRLEYVFKVLREPAGDSLSQSRTVITTAVRMMGNAVQASVDMSMH